MFHTKHLSIAACALLMLAACKKDKNEDSDPVDLDYTAASDNARAEDAFDDMMAQTDAAASDRGLRDMEDGCNPTVTIDTISMPHVMNIDFGSVNCTANNGRQRRGVLHVTFTGRYRDAGTVITITPQNYYVNGSIAALCLDLTMRRESNGAICLDDVLRSLWRSTFDEGRGYTLDDVRGAVRDLGGANALRALDTMTAGARKPVQMIDMGDAMVGTADTGR